MKTLCKLRFTIGPTSACNTFRFRSAAAVWIMMAVITMASSPARAECIGTMVALNKGEAALRCPLTVNVKATRHSIVVRYFREPESSSEDVMDCHWPTEEATDPDCHSKYNFSLGSQLTDQVVAKVPVSSLNGSGTFKCQLLPPNNDQSSIGCQIYHFRDNDEAEQPAVTGTPVVSPDSSNSDMPDQKPLKRETSHCAEQSHATAMTVAILGLQIIICLLLAVNVLIIRCQKNQRFQAWRVCRPKSTCEVNRVYIEPANPPPEWQDPLLTAPDKPANPPPEWQDPLLTVPEKPTRSCVELY